MTKLTDLVDRLEAENAQLRQDEDEMEADNAQLRQDKAELLTVLEKVSARLDQAEATTRAALAKHGKES